jgi:hypothetical protein
MITSTVRPLFSSLTPTPRSCDIALNRTHLPLTPSPCLAPHRPQAKHEAKPYLKAEPGVADDVELRFKDKDKGKSAGSGKYEYNKLVLVSLVVAVSQPPLSRPRRTDCHDRAGGNSRGGTLGMWLTRHSQPSPIGSPLPPPSTARKPVSRRVVPFAQICFEQG